MKARSGTTSQLVVSEEVVPTWNKIRFSCECGHNWQTTRNMIIARSRQCGKTAMLCCPSCHAGIESINIVILDEKA
jgi:hypothetical protein